MTRGGYVDGCFQDRSNEEEFPGVSNAVLSQYREGHDEVLRDMQSALDASTIRGMVVQNNYNNSGTSAKATMMEFFAADEASIVQLMSLANQGFIVQAHAGYAPNGADNHCDTITNSLSAFLIGASSGCFYACSTEWDIDPLWPAPGHKSDWMTFHPEYAKPLGPPLGPAVKNAIGVYSRTFGNGTTVTFDTKTNVGNIQWA